MLRYLAALREVARYRLDGGNLRLETARGGTLLSTRGTAPAGSIDPDFMGTTWQLASLDGAPLAEDASITFGFGTEAKMDCNFYTYTVSMTRPGAIDVQTGATTAMGCYPQSTTLEQWIGLTERYTSTLNAAARYRVDGSQLRLMTDDERELVYRAVTPSTP